MFLVVEFVLILVLTGMAVVRADLMSSLSEALASAAGIANCQNKCDKVFDRTQYAISDQPNADTFEFRSCVIGCNQCSSILHSLPANGTAQVKTNANSSSSGTGGKSHVTSHAVPKSCFRFCKTFDYSSKAIRKGLIEPDKACLMGCVINTCQEICTGGTTDNAVTDANRFLWWGLGGNGCSIKSGGGYVQNPSYGNPNSPGGQGGSTGLKACCTQLINLCSYRGTQTNNINYENVGVVARRQCRGLVPQRDLNNNTALCEFYNTPQFCGTEGMSGVSSGNGTDGGGA